MSFDCMVHKKVRRDDIQKDQIMQLNRAVDIGIEQLCRNQVVDGPTSRENMKRKIDTLARGK